MTQSNSKALIFILALLVIFCPLGIESLSTCVCGHAVQPSSIRKPNSANCEYLYVSCGSWTIDSRSACG